VAGPAAAVVTVRRRQGLCAEPNIEKNRTNELRTKPANNA